jgi:hypothetical protein
MAASNRPAYQEFYDAPWNKGLFRPILIAVLATSAIAGPLAIMRAMTEWQLNYVLPLAFVMALEGVYSTNQLGRPNWRDRRGLFFRLGELVLFLLVLRLAIWIFSGALPTATDFWFWLRHPGSFFDGHFVSVGLLLVLAWGLAIAITGDFLDLAIQPDEVAAHDSHSFDLTASQMRVFRPVSRGDIMRRFAARWAWGGLVVVFFAAMSRVTLGSNPAGGVRIGLARVGLPSDILAALVCYFLAGLLLMSQARLAVLRGRWYNQDIRIMPQVLRRWQVNGLLMLLLVAGLAALLPIGSTNWLGMILEMVIAFLVRIAYFLLMLMTALIGLLLYPLRFLFNSQGTEAPASMPAMQVPSQAEVAKQLPDWLSGSVVWVIVALIVGYFLVNYLGAHGLLKGRWADVLARLRFWLRARLARLGASASGAMARARDRLRPPRVVVRSVAGVRFVRVSVLPPRERVRYFYLKMVGRAADRGLTRPAHATPLEYVEDLESQWPDADEDLRGLTEAFLAARYDRRNILVTEAKEVQSIWRRVMRALRGKTGSEQTPK